MRFGGNLSLHRFIFKLAIHNEVLFIKSFKSIHHLQLSNIIFLLNSITNPKELKNAMRLQNAFQQLTLYFVCRLNSK